MNKKWLLGIVSLLFIIGISVIVYFKLSAPMNHKTISKSSQASSSVSMKSSSKQDSSTTTTSSKETVSTSDDNATETGKPSDQAEGKEQTKTRSTSFDFNAMTHGNYSSVKGVWQNAAGEKIIFNEKGMVNDTDNITSFNYDAAGNLIVNVQSGYTGYAIWFVMKGNTIAPEGDTSDTNQDRIFAGQSLPGDVAASAYYRVSQ